MFATLLGMAAAVAVVKTPDARDNLLGQLAGLGPEQHPLKQRVVALCKSLRTFSNTGRKAQAASSREWQP